MLLLLRKRFNPRNIPNLQLWLPADRINQADSTSVATWSDQSGNGYDATQGNSAARPTYIASGLNGLPVVRFDGTDDVLTISNSATTFKFLHSDVSTVFLVAKAGVVADPNTIYGFLGTSAVGSANIGYELFYDDRSSASRNNGITHRIYRGAVNTFVVTQVLNNYFLPNTFGLLSVVSDPANAIAAERSAISLNGGNVNKTNAATDSLSTSSASFNLQIGAAGFNIVPLNGDIAEIIVYNRTLNTSELSQVHRYLGRKWGIQLA